MRRTVKKIIATVLTAAMAIGATVPAYADMNNDIKNDEIGKQVCFRNNGHGQYILIQDTAIGAKNISMQAGNDIIQAEVTDREDFYQISENQYLVQAYSNVYTLAKKIHLNPFDFNANLDVLDSYNISEALKEDIKENIEKEQNKNNDNFTVDLYVPSVNNAKNTTNVEYFDYNGYRIRNTIVDYGYLSTDLIKKDGSKAKNEAAALKNFGLSCAGCIYKTVGIFGAGKSALDLYIAKYGAVSSGSATDKTYTTLLYNKYTKQTDCYNKAVSSWEEGCLSKSVYIYQNTTYQYYASNGKELFSQSPLSETYNSEHYTDVQFAINTAPVCYIDSDIYVTIYGKTVRL